MPTTKVGDDKDQGDDSNEDRDDMGRVLEIRRALTATSSRSISHLELSRDGGPLGVHVAAMQGSLDVLQMFVDSDSEALESLSADGRTILHFACQKGNLAVAFWLFEEHAEAFAQLLDSSDRYGRTPLHFAVTSGSQPLVSFLLDAGADAAVADHNGNTPLHLATINGLGACVQLLSSQTPLLSQPDSAGRTPLDWAFSKLLRYQNNYGSATCPSSSSPSPSNNNPAILNELKGIIRILRDAASLTKRSKGKAPGAPLEQITRTLMQLRLDISDSETLHAVDELCDLFSIPLSPSALSNPSVEGPSSSFSL